MFNGLDITCLVNPAVGKEKEFEFESASVLKKVLVVGGGPAGLNAAIIAKKRGHEVILAEKEKHLGGQLVYASIPPKKDVIKRLIDYFSGQVNKLGITSYSDKEVNREFVKEISPDVVIMATGATPIVPTAIPGIKEKNVFLATEILGGKKPLGKKSIIIGGGQTGLETADFLAEAGQEVIIIEMLSEVGIDMPPRNKIFLMKKLSDQNIRILVNQKVKEITNKGVYVDHFNEKEEIQGDTVVVSIGYRPKRILLEEIEPIIPEFNGLYILGDCIIARTALEAIAEAARIAKEI
jgi:NADPH-dependent 2,4-dienoyl-CoA reductase/sulfur reductase-like enzyme